MKYHITLAHHNVFAELAGSGSPCTLDETMYISYCKKKELERQVFVRYSSLVLLLIAHMI